MSYLSDIEKINKLAKSLKDTGIAANMEDAVQMAESILKRSKSPEERHAETSRMPAEEKKSLVESEINELTEENKAADAEEQNRAEAEKEYVPQDSPSAEVREEETTEDVMREESIIDEAIASSNAPAEGYEHPDHEEKQEGQERKNDKKEDAVGEKEAYAGMKTEEFTPAPKDVLTADEKRAREQSEVSAPQMESRLEESEDEKLEGSRELQRIEKQQEHREEESEQEDSPEEKTDDEELPEEHIPEPSEELMQEYSEMKHPSEKIDKPVGDSTIFSEYRAEQKEEKNKDEAKTPDAPDYDITQEDKTLAELMAEDAAAIYGTPEKKEEENVPAEGIGRASHNESSAEGSSGEEAVEEFTREIPVDKDKERPTLTEEEKKNTDLSRIFNFSGKK